MNDKMRLIKFQNFIKDINKETARSLSLGLFEMNERYRDILYGGERIICKNEIMMLIYDYDRLNEYGRIILENSNIFTDYGGYEYEALKDERTKLRAAKIFIEYCSKDADIKDSLEFIFWSLMVLTVDKTDKEEKLSLICDFARMLKVTNDEVLDIVHIIKMLYGEESEKYEFKTRRAEEKFGGLIYKYKNTRCF
jgi:hypothetical protein